MNFNINKVAVLGAGVMGAGIAGHLAGAGFCVCLLDIVPNKLTEEEMKIGLTKKSKKFRNRFAQSGKDYLVNPKNRALYTKDMADMIQIGNFSDDLDMLSDCDWIIEVIIEKLDIKKIFMKQISNYIKPGAIVTSNTSGISINEIVEDMPLEFRQNSLGTHFFNPPRYMKLFEIIPNKDTTKELIEYMSKFATKRLGKGVVSAKDTPNFVGNRIGAYSLSNAIQLTEKYQFSLEKADKLTGSIMYRPKSATFSTCDIVGLDTLRNVFENFSSKVETEKKYFVLPKFVSGLIEKGHFGNKTKKGFYKKVKVDKGRVTLAFDYLDGGYTELKKEKLEVKTLTELIYGKTKESKFAWEIVKNVLLYSARNVPEIADDYKDIDSAMIWGYNWEKGPFQIWDEIGIKKSIEKIESEGEKIPAWIKDKVLDGFYNKDSEETEFLSIASSKNKIVKENDGAALIDLGNGVLCLQFKSKSNSITNEVIEMIGTAVEETEKNYKGLVVGNQSKNFSVGANLEMIGGLISNKDWAGVETVVETFQAANMKLKYCKKPVVAAAYGMTLGGGAEIVMHSHAVTAHAETYMGLVEMGVGLIPGGGGIKELLIRSTEGLGRATTGELLKAIKPAFNNIAMAKVSSSGHDAIKLGVIRNTDRIVMSLDYLVEEAKNEVLYLVNCGFRPVQKKAIRVLGSTGKAALQFDIEMLLSGGFITEHDAIIAQKIAHVLTGGDVPNNTMLTEDRILELEKEAFVDLCKEEKTIQRIEHMLTTGKTLRN